MSSITVSRSGPLSGSIRPPSDKSLTHRALMFASIADGSCVIKSPLLGNDCFATLKCLCAMGTHASGQRHDWIKVTPSPEWCKPEGFLDCGNSGTTMRILAGLLAGQSFESTLVGDASLSRRPMGRILAPLRLMGANIEGETAPLNIIGSSLSPITYESPVASAQVKSCILLAGMGIEGVTTVVEPAQSRDHTERMLAALGVPVLSGPGGISLSGPVKLPAFEFEVPGDISSAAFWLVAAALVEGSRVTLHQVGLNPTRTGVIDALVSAGVQIEVWDQSFSLGEPSATLSVRACSQLKGFEICGSLVPRLIDEIPILAVMATQAEGLTVIRDAGELRVKESDRIARIVEGLSAMGANIQARADGMEIQGPTPLTGITLSAGHDHRIAMSFLIAGLVAGGQTTVTDCETIATSYPDFEPDLLKLLN